jgi:hypothetical protein
MEYGGTPTRQYSNTPIFLPPRAVTKNAAVCHNAFPTRDLTGYKVDKSPLPCYLRGNSLGR